MSNIARKKDIFREGTSKERIIIYILAVLLLIILGYWGYQAYQEAQEAKAIKDMQAGYEQGYRAGYEEAIVQLMQEASTCNPVPVRYLNSSMNIMALECPQMQAFIGQMQAQQG